MICTYLFGNYIVRHSNATIINKICSACGVILFDGIGLTQLVKCITHTLLNVYMRASVRACVRACVRAGGRVNVLFHIADANNFQRTRGYILATFFNEG